MYVFMEMGHSTSVGQIGSPSKRGLVVIEDAIREVRLYMFDMTTSNFLDIGGGQQCLLVLLDP